MPSIWPKIGRIKARNTVNVSSPYGGIHCFQGLVTTTDAVYILPQEENWAGTGEIRIRSIPTVALLKRRIQPSQGPVTSTETLYVLFHRRKMPKTGEAKARNREIVTSSLRGMQSFVGLVTGTDTFCMLLHREEMPKTRGAKVRNRAIVAHSNKFSIFSRLRSLHRCVVYALSYRIFAENRGNKSTNTPIVAHLPNNSNHSKLYPTTISPSTLVPEPLGWNTR